MQRGLDEICGAEATHVAVTPWGQRRDICEEHASELARVDGFRVGPRGRICETCLQVKPQDYGFWCWCGAKAEKRYQVEGLWFALCAAHKPPTLWDLGKRLALKWARMFKRKPRNTSELLAKAIADARERAKRER